ncbi:nuclease-related domain-containing protein [Bacillus sp. CGMCC 1.16607]|uniref:nuclease-related domain-containing protein n=1 Tax=Bacillus sp. CGMCC 1.16607 TaxID=3351842 RepID=UPI00362A43C2
MIINKHPRATKMIVCEALSRRIIPHHPKIGIIKDDLAAEISGHKGEQSLDYYLEPLSEKRYQILHGLRLPNGQRFFQIDSLVISPNFILPIEAKNHTGTIYLDSDFNQMIQEKPDYKKVWPDPVLQVERQQWELRKWLQTHRFPSIPIVPLVAFTNKNCLLTTAPGNEKIYEKVCKPGDLFNRVNQLEKQFQEEKYCPKTIGKLTRLLLKKHTPHTASSILAQYNITSSDILTGAQCPNCFKIPMSYYRGTWICPICRTQSEVAHIQAIHDYFLLIKPTITNIELRQFLHLPNEKAAQRILISLKLPFFGDKRWRVYHANGVDILGL